MDLRDAQDSIMQYVEKGVPCGGFLTAVLENNLMGAVVMADESSRTGLVAICGFVYNDIPGKCHGSPEKVKAWLAKFKNP